MITDVDGERIKAGSDLVRILNRRDDGDVTLNVTRDKRTRTIKVTPEKAQANTIFAPEAPLAPPAAFTLPRVRVQTPRAMVAPRVIVAPRAPVAPRRALTPLRVKPVVL